MDEFLAAAIAEAREGLRQGGIPIGSVLVCDGAIIGRALYDGRVNLRTAVKRFS